MLIIPKKQTSKLAKQYLPTDICDHIILVNKKYLILSIYLKILGTADDMNMSKFTPFYGAPVWETIFEEGTFDYDWKKMNCLNFVFIPKGIDSMEILDELYNRHVKRFYTDPGWRKKFRKRIWEHRWSMWYFITHLPAFLSAMRTFEPDGN